MACEPIQVRCGCGALIDCQHDPEADAAFPLLPQYEALERDVAASIADLDEREAAVKELGGRFLAEALRVRRQFLEQSVTWCPGCGEPVRVEFQTRPPRVVLADVDSGQAHWCPALPVAPSTVERLRASDRTDVRTVPDTSAGADDFGVEVPRLG